MANIPSVESFMNASSSGLPLYIRKNEREWSDDNDFREKLIPSTTSKTQIKSKFFQDGQIVANQPRINETHFQQRNQSTKKYSQDVQFVSHNA